MKTSNNLNQMFLPIQSNVTLDWPDGFYNDTDGYMFKHNGEAIGFDIETKGLNPYCEAHIISYAISDGIKTFAQVIRHNETVCGIKEIELLKQIVSNKNYILIGHNIKFDLNWLRIKFGFDIQCQIFDTMIASYLLDENTSGSLDNTYQRFTNKKSHKGMVNTSNLELEPLDDVLLYNAKDAKSVMELYPLMVKSLEDKKILKLATIANQIVPILSKMETRGVKVDIQRAKENQKKLFNSVITKRVDLGNFGYGSFDPDSPKDLTRILYKQLEFTVIKETKTGNPSTDAEAIKLLEEQTTDPKEIKFLTDLLSYKKDMKLLSSIYQKIDEQTKYDGKRHAKYNLGKQYGEDSGGTVTGRLSGDMQQIPRGKEHKAIFIPQDGYVFIDGDFSQLELRVVAFLAQEPAMLKAFDEGLDIHTAVMADIKGYDYYELFKLLEDETHKDNKQLKEERVAIKRINFGIVYGVAAPRLQRLLKIELGVEKPLDECEYLIARWLDKFPKVNQWLEQQRNNAAIYKQVVMPFGQRRRLPDADFIMRGMDKEKRILASRALRQATNFPVQSMASWICLIGMLLLDEYFEQRKELDGCIVIQVHDSITAEVKKLDSLPTDYKIYYDGKGSSSYLNEIATDIQYIMEYETRNYIQNVFNINFNVPLSFPVKVLERWQ